MPAPIDGPKYLNLFQIQMPVGAVLSIAHRVSGAVLFLSLPLLVYLLDLSLQGPAGFDQAGRWLDSPPVQVLSLLLVWSLSHHLLAGIRHLMLDLHIGVEKAAARRTAWISNLTALAVTLVYGGSLVL
jgi:succinate dehydrogenase / fumarate reductase cytochrome b subunit